MPHDAAPLAAYCLHFAHRQEPAHAHLPASQLQADASLAVLPQS